MTTTIVMEKPTSVEDLRNERRRLAARRDELDHRTLAAEESEELFKVRVGIARFDEQIKIAETPPTPNSPCPLHGLGIDRMLARAQKNSDKLAVMAQHFDTAPTLVVAHLSDRCEKWYVQRAMEDTATQLLEAQLVELVEQLPADTLRGKFRETKDRISEVKLELEQHELRRKAVETQVCAQWDIERAADKQERERQRRAAELDAKRTLLAQRITSSSGKTERLRAELQGLEREIAQMEKAECLTK